VGQLVALVDWDQQVEGEEVGEDEVVTGVRVGVGLRVRAADKVPPESVGEEVRLYCSEPVTAAVDLWGVGDDESVVHAVEVKEGVDVEEDDDFGLLGVSLVILGEEEEDTDGVAEYDAGIVGVIVLDRLG